MNETCSGVVALARRGADRDELRSLRLLAQMYERGCGVDEDQPRAGALYRRILKKNPNDPVALGFLTFYGDGRPKDRRRSASLFERAVNEHVPFATCELATALSNLDDPAAARRGHDVDVAAAADGDERSHVRVGIDDLFGSRESAPNPSAGISILSDGLHRGDGLAAVYLALAYRDGKGVERDPDRATAYFKQGAALGNATAMYLLENTYSVRSDHAAMHADGIRLLETSAARLYDNATIKADLGSVYTGGHGVDADYPRAVALLRRGAADGVTSAMDDLAYLEFHGYGLPSDFVAAVRLLRKSAAAGDGNAKRSLALIHIDAEETAQIPLPPASDDYYQQQIWQSQHPTNVLPAPGSPADMMIHDGE